MNRLVRTTKRSESLYRQALKSIVGGVTARNKELAPHPIYIKEAKGAHLVDIDGNRYLDLVMGVGVHILGHAPAPVIEALRHQLDQAIYPTLATESEVVLAQKVQQHMPHLERVRFTNSGTEASMMALRAARAFTGKDRIAKFEGNYHGQHDGVLFSGLGSFAGDPNEPVSVPDSPGIPKVLSETVLMLPFNDAERSVALIERHHHDLAAVIVEPVAGFVTGAVPAQQEFMDCIRRVTAEYGIVLIWDEVVTGFRMGLGGMAPLLGLKPDLTLLGKILGGGMPIGAFGGRADLMEAVLGAEADQNQKIFHSGTFTGNPMTMAAGIAVINELERLNPYAELSAAGDELRSDLHEVADSAGFATQVTGLGSMFHIHFTDIPIRSIRDTRKANRELQRQFSMQMIDRGIYLPPNHPGFLSTAHTSADRKHIVDTAASVLDQIAAS